MRQAELGLAAGGAIAAVLITFGIDGPARAVFTFAILLVLPGWSIVRLLGFKDRFAQLGLTLVASALVVCLISLAMVWFTWWHPVIVAVLLLLASSLSLVLIRGSGPRDAESLIEPEQTANPRHVRTSSRAALVGWVLLAVAIALWAVEIVLTRVSDLGDWGLLSVFPIAWYVAVALVFAGCLAGLTSSRISDSYLATSVGALIVMLYASANLVEDAPRLPWVYKHIAVTRYIDTFGSVDPSIDIYHRWPGFFSFTAFLGEVIGYPNPVSYAAWAETIFPLVNVVLILGIARAISRVPAWYWTTAIVFSIGNWVGQNYFAPQSLAFSMYLAITLIVVTCLRAEPRWLGRLVERVLTRRRFAGSSASADAEQMTSTPRTAQRWTAIIAVLLLQAAIVASHQLTPYLVVLALLPLFLLGFFRPTWLGFALLALAIAYLIPNLDYVQQNFGIFSSFDPVANATYSAVDQTLVSDASKWQGRGASALTVLIIGLAGAGFVRRLWGGHVRSTLIVAWLAVAPMLTLLGQTYGGEGKFRVFLFGLPFYAMGVAWLFWPAKAQSFRSRVGCWVALTMMMVLFVAVYFQPEASYRVQGSDIAASEWLDQNLRGGDQALTTVPSNFPVLIGPNYYLLNTTGPFASVWNYLQYNNIKSLSIADVKAYVASARQGSGHVYLIFSDSQEQYAVAHQLFAAGQLPAVEDLVRQDPDSVSVYNSGTVRVYEYR